MNINIDYNNIEHKESCVIDERFIIQERMRNEICTRSRILGAIQGQVYEDVVHEYVQLHGIQIIHHFISKLASQKNQSREAVKNNHPNLQFRIYKL